jgi:hypothetical protein
VAAKFLVGRDGTVLSRYAPTSSPNSIEGDIKAALAKTLEGVVTPTGAAKPAEELA